MQGLANQAYLAVVEFLLLGQQRVWHQHLAEVHQRGGNACGAGFCRAELHFIGDFASHLGNAHRMVGGIGIPPVDQRNQHRTRRQGGAETTPGQQAQATAEQGLGGFIDRDQGAVAIDHH